VPFLYLMSLDIFFFLCTSPAVLSIYTLSLHDALPILGVGEPVPSWGNMLASLQKYYVLTSYWWMFVPGLALVLMFLLNYQLCNVDRKSTRLNSSHGSISYAVFCLKKKK